MWFCYEKSTTGEWQPVAYHQFKPGNEITKKKRSTIWKVPENCIDMDGSVNFYQLQKMFKKPKE